MVSPLPDWVEEELSYPEGPGGRNDQMIRIGPVLIKHGHTIDTLFNLFSELYGHPDDLSESEIMAVCRQSCRYALQEDGGLNKGEWVERRKHLNGLVRYVRAKLPQILEDYRWPMAEIKEFEELPLSQQRRDFLNWMFDINDIIWIGQVWETGERERNGRMVNYASRFKTRDQWLVEKAIRGEFVSHCTFKLGTNSRCNEAVMAKKYMVVESDLLGVDEVGAVFNYLSNTHSIKLRAVVSTGGKSIHGWFEWPTNANKEAMEEWAAVIEGLKCDPSTLRPSQPVRLPGTIRRDTGRPQELLWIA